MMKCILFGLFILPCFSYAQHWRIEGNGGIAVPAMSKELSTVRRPPYTSTQNRPVEIPTDIDAISAMVGLKLMRRDSSSEYGLGVSMMPIHFKEWRPGSTSYNHAYIARPAIPITAFYNYCPRRRRTYAFVGLNAGIIIARGRDAVDAGMLNANDKFTVYFNDGVGYTFGGQLGVRRALGHFDAGLQLQMNYAYLSLTQGTSRDQYSLNLFYFPVLLFVGYSL
jgi:hypothetical protein